MAAQHPGTTALIPGRDERFGDQPGRREGRYFRARSWRKPFLSIPRRGSSIRASSAGSRVALPPQRSNTRQPLARSKFTRKDAREADRRSANPLRPPSNLFEPPGCVLVEQTRDQRLIRQPLCERSLLNRLEILARQPDVQPTVLAERRLGVAGVPSSLALAAAGGLPLAALDGLKQFLLVGVNLLGTPDRATPSWPSDSG